MSQGSEQRRAGDEVVSRKRAALANTAFSGLQTIVAVVNGLVLVPVYLQYLDPAEYGTWLATGNVLGWLTIIDPGVGDLARQRVAMLYGARRWDEACSVIWTGGVIVALMSIGMAALASMTAQPLVSVLDLSDPRLADDAAKALAIAGYGAALAFFGAYLSGVIQSLQRTIWIGIVVVVGSVILPVVRLVMLANGSGMEALAWGMVAQGVFVAGASVVLLASRIRAIGLGFRFGFSQLGPLLNLTLFTSLQRIASIAAINMRGILVTRYLGAETNFMCEVTRAPIEFARVFLDKPISAFTPAFAHLKGAGAIQQISEYLLRFASISLAALALCIAGYVSLNGAFVELWLGPGYYLGDSLNALIAIGVGIAVIMNLARGFLYAMGEIQHVSVVISLLAIGGVVSEYVGLRVLGLAGLLGGPILLTTVFCFVGFPIRVVRNYLSPVARSQLLWHVVCPVAFAGGVAGISGLFLQRLTGAPSWGKLAMIAVFESGVFTLLSVLSSPLLRREWIAVQAWVRHRVWG
jgi:O-antigen/teichoic acid export membrane protein